MIRTPHLLLLVPCLSTVACSNQGSVDLGRNVGGALTDYAATWDGYGEAFLFDDGSDHVLITLDGNGQGTLVVGDQPAPPPLAPSLDDPNTPPDSLVNFSGLTPAFPYTIEGAQVEEKRIRLGVVLRERYRDWCNMQASFCDGTICGCVPDWTAVCDPGAGTCTQQNPDTGAIVSFPYNKMQLCAFNPVCDCDASGCTVSHDSGMQFDGALENDGTDLVGTLVLRDRVAVRLTRD